VPVRRITLSSALRDLSKVYASWAILLAVSIDLLAIAVEPGMLVLHRAPKLAAAGALLDTFGLSTLFGAIAALPVTAVHGLVRLARRAPRPWRFAWPLPLLGLAGLVILDVAPRPIMNAELVPVASALLFAFLAGLMVFATVLVHLRSGRVRSVAGALAGVAALGVSLSLPVYLHRQPRDILWLGLVISAATALYPLRRTLEAMAHERVGRAFGALVAFSMLSLLSFVVSPNWRVYENDGQFAERLGRFCRKVLDFDDDGFSAVLGGLDCDDWDRRRNPIAAEYVDGVDRNCNGQTRPASPTAAERGLAPPAGDPDAQPGEIERFILITVDCLRSDVMSPTRTPSMLRLAARGLVLTKLYAGATYTAAAVPLLLRGAYEAPSLAAILEANGISTTAIFAYRHDSLEANVIEGFGVVRRPLENDHRFRAGEVTDLALQDLGHASRTQRHFLWVHYFDPHGPRSLRVLPPDVPRFPPLEHDDPDSAVYLSEVAYDDREIGRLIEGIDATGDAARTAIVVSGDHGEGFGVHGVYEHGESAFEEVIHVPGIFTAPGIRPGTYGHVTSHRDVAATVLGAFGLVRTNPAVETFGRSWLRLRAAPEEPLHDFVITYSTSAHVGSWQEAPMVVRTGDDAKLAVGYREGVARLYHPGSAEDERRDVSPAYPEELARDRVQLERFRDIDTSPP
jgi:arylsulfatase A-like enzyme